MLNVYDNWERLVGAVLQKQQLWQMFHDRSPSVSSTSSDFSWDSELHDVAFDFSSPGGSPPYQQQPPPAVEKPRKKEKSLAKVVPGLIFVDGSNSHFDLEDVLRASAEFIGKGTFGSAYIAGMDNGISIVVKRLKVAKIQEKKFRQHMEVIGNVRHENVSVLRAYYFSQDERLMLYDHYSSGSVSAMLHGKTGNNQAHLDWETRLRIAVGAARGIAHIHMQNGGKLVHGNIKSSNIFLNSQQYGCVSDLGLANMIATPVNRTARYHAPEVNYTKNASQASDVYSFGILLLELLTRKSPFHATDGNEVVDLVKLVNSLSSIVQTINAFDVELLRNPSIREQTVKMLQTAMSCVAKTPRKRPKMAEVLKMMEDISTMNARNHSQLNLVFMEGLNPAFDFEDMLRASAEVLGKGSFGTSYKTSLENGITIVVKRLRDVNGTIKEFQQQMEVIGRMRHENVSALMAYYWSRDEKLVVYDYHSHGSVSAMLHGKSGKNKISLDWKTRLRIAVGAARGVAHIHEQLGHKFLHGNVKASNIFLNAQGYGCVSEIGFATSLSGLTRPFTLSPEYHGPELLDTNKLSQASDVYSLGVVLLELLSGKPSILPAKDGEDKQLVRWVYSVIQEEWTDKVFDEELLRRYPDMEEAMVQLLQVAMNCVATVPVARPKMSQVVKMLEHISETNRGAN